MSCPPVNWDNVAAVSSRASGIGQDNRAPIGSGDDRCGVYELLGDHGVYWLECRRML